MKKKILSLLLIIVTIFGLTGCGKKYLIGDKVSTDLVEFTIETSKLTLAIDSEGKVKDYEEGEHYKYVASKGHVYASFTLIIKNLDRSKLELSNDFITAKYNGKKSNILEVVSSSEDLAKWNSISKISMAADKELTYRGFIEIDSDATDLDDDFELIVELPKSDGSTEKYVFEITKDSRENAVIREITLETAINRYPLSVTIEYFEKYLDEFETLNGTQITEFVKSNDGDHYLQFNSDTAKHYEFGETKASGNNLIMWPGGTGASSFMFTPGKWSVDGDVLNIDSRECRLKKLTDKYYLLIDTDDNSIDGLMR